MSVIPGPAKVAVTSSRHLTICGLMRRAMLAEKFDFVPCLLREDLGLPAITEQKAHGNRDGDCQHHGRRCFRTASRSTDEWHGKPFFHQDRANVETAEFQSLTISPVVAGERSLCPRRARTGDVHEIKITCPHQIAKSSRCLGS
jgi:hypothetical protein